MKRWIIPLAVLTITAGTVLTAFAQQPQNGDQGGRGGRGPGVLMVCSTGNPTDTVAEVLGMSAADVRVALVSGQSINDLAASKNVEMSAIQDALTSLRQSELENALSSSLLTQEQYDAIIARMGNAPGASGNAPIGIRVPDHNLVHRGTVAAEVLGMSCADLVKAVQGGKSIAEIAQDQNVEVQSVIDAVAKAYQDALAQDVSEGLITQAQAEGFSSNLTIEIGHWVYSTRPEGGRNGSPFGQDDGHRGPGGERPFGEGRPDRAPFRQPGDAQQPTTTPNT